MKLSMVLRFSYLGRSIASLVGVGLFLILMGIWLGVLAFVLAVPFMIVLSRSIKDYDFNLTPEGFKYEKTEVQWGAVKKVEFSNIDKFSTSRFTRRFYDPVINVHTKEKKLAIITQNYKESRALRDAFEEACREKSIKIKVEDRG